MHVDKFGNKRYKVGLHIHTTFSDGRVSPEKAAKIYKENGFDAIAITDHWVYHSEGEIEGLKILSGCEYNLGGRDTSVEVVHIVGIGMESDPRLQKNTVDRQEVVDAILAHNGLAIFAHPAWSLNSIDDIMAISGIDAIEIYNTVSGVGQNSRPYSGYFIDTLSNRGEIYPLVATDDVHYYDGSDECKSFIMVKAKSLEQKDVLKAIRKGDFYATQGPELHIQRKGRKIIADCSECVMISFLSNASWNPERIVRGNGLTHAEYEINSYEKWVRVEVCDDQGRYAWSNIVVV